MEKVKNVLHRWQEKLNSKAETEAQSEVAVEQPMVDEMIVSDFAVAQGAPCKQPTGDSVHDRYHWIDRASVKELYHTNARGEKNPNFCEQPIGMAPSFDHTFVNHLSIQGNYLTYREKDKPEYVFFPQRRITGQLAKDLTTLALGKFQVPESEFGRLSYVVRQYGSEVRNKVGNACYYYQGHGYCARVDATNTKDPLQWFELRPVMAKWVGEQIQCEDQLIADYFYREDKVLADFQNSVSVEREIPKMYTKTPIPHGLGDGENEMVR